MKIFEIKLPVYLCDGTGKLEVYHDTYIIFNIINKSFYFIDEKDKLYKYTFERKKKCGGCIIKNNKYLYTISNENQDGNCNITEKIIRLNFLQYLIATITDHNFYKKLKDHIKYFSYFFKIN